MTDTQGIPEYGTVEYILASLHANRLITQLNALIAQNAQKRDPSELKRKERKERNRKWKLRCSGRLLLRCTQKRVREQQRMALIAAIYASLEEHNRILRYVWR